jgi:hypothetical protein
MHLVNRLNLQILVRNLRAAGRGVPAVTTNQNRPLGCVWRLLEDDDLVTVAREQNSLGSKRRLVDGVLPGCRNVGRGVDLGSGNLCSTFRDRGRRPTHMIRQERCEVPICGRVLQTASLPRLSSIRIAICNLVNRSAHRIDRCVDCERLIILIEVVEKVLSELSGVGDSQSVQEQVQTRCRQVGRQIGPVDRLIDIDGRTGKDEDGQEGNEMAQHGCVRDCGDAKWWMDRLELWVVEATMTGFMGRVPSVKGWAPCRRVLSVNVITGSIDNHSDQQCVVQACSFERGEDTCIA